MVAQLAEAIVSVTVKRINSKLQKKNACLLTQRTRSNCNLMWTADIITDSLMGTKNIKNFIYRCKAIFSTVWNKSEISWALIIWEVRLQFSTIAHFHKSFNYWVATRCEEPPRLLKNFNCPFANGICSCPVLCAWCWIIENRKVVGGLVSRSCLNIIFEDVNLRRRNEIVTDENTFISVTRSVYSLHRIIAVHGVKPLRDQRRFSW